MPDHDHDATGTRRLTPAPYPLDDADDDPRLIALEKQNAALIAHVQRLEALVTALTHRANMLEHQVDGMLPDFTRLPPLTLARELVE